MSCFIPHEASGGQAGRLCDTRGLPRNSVPSDLASPDHQGYLRPQPPPVQDAKAGFSDPAYETSDGIRQVIDAIYEKSPVIFVSGRAGTGKSRLIDYLGKLPGGRRQAVVAPTGIAALSLGAQTIHSLFRLPVGVVDPAALPEDRRLAATLGNITRLVIDEISMVRADILDAIDARLRAARGPGKPFGGVQLVMVGDFLQLPPVVRPEDRQLLEHLGYETPFAFSARALESVRIRVATLRKVWRQSEPDMIAALGAIREGRRLDGALAWLNDRCTGPHRAGVEPLLLTATRAAADAYNGAGMEEVRSGHGRMADHLQACIQAEASGDFSATNAALPAPRALQLLPGARVMAVRNDPEGVYVNGSLGEVREVFDGNGALDEAYVLVRFDGHTRDVRITAADWTKARQVWNAERDAIEQEECGRFRQIPLTQGYAITIHKSQGLSLDDVRIDLGRGAFAPGQLYVALSRARSMAGLSFARPLRVSDVRVDEMMVRFLEWARGSTTLERPAPPKAPQPVPA